MEFKPECRVCRAAMQPGFQVTSPHTLGLGVFQIAPIKVTSCWKCPACGHSFVPRLPVPT